MVNKKVPEPGNVLKQKAETPAVHLCVDKFVFWWLDERLQKATDTFI